MTSYQFPKITHLDQVLKAIQGREEFVVKVDEIHGYTIINYLLNLGDTFPPVVDERTAILRECRGITFDTKTGKVLSRKYHKFFNLGERPETLPENMDFNRTHRYLEKLDGSMITPLLINGKIRWCTKMGLTDVAKPVDEWTADRLQYHELSKYWMSRNHTPIFEWCSRQQRIVIDYAETQLVLTAIRNNETGEYLDYHALNNEADAYRIPVIKSCYPVNGFSKDRVEYLRTLEGEEGEVWRFDDGHMVKLKGEWYLQLHKTLEHLNHEKDVIRLILDEKIDDAKPFLLEDIAKALDNFAKDLMYGLKTRASDLYWEVQTDYDNLNASKKRFAERLMSQKLDEDTKLLNGLKFWMWDHISDGEIGIYDYLKDFVKNRTSTQTKVNAMRFLWQDATWSSYRDAPKEE